MIFLYIMMGIAALYILMVAFRILESGYSLAFNKPLYVHFHPIPGKLSKSQLALLEAEFPFYNRLSVRKKRFFAHRVKSFIKKYPFFGKEELEITAEMKILVAATYVMLTFGIRDYQLQLFDKIVIYPSVFYSRQSDNYHKGEFNPMMKAVVFSWEDFLMGHITNNDNINLGLHEFSHVLHLNAIKYNSTSMAIFYDEFNAVVKYFDDDELNSTLVEKAYFRDYTYTNRFEFLAVILEHFFETPHTFRKEFPILYAHVATMINFQSA